MTAPALRHKAPRSGADPERQVPRRTMAALLLGLPLLLGLAAPDEAYAQTSCNLGEATTVATNAFNWHATKGGGKLASATVFYRTLITLKATLPTWSGANISGAAPTTAISAAEVRTFSAGNSWDGWATILTALDCLEGADQIQISHTTRSVAEFGDNQRVTVEVADGARLMSFDRTVNYTLDGTAERGDSDTDYTTDYTIEGCPSSSSSCTLTLPANRHSASIVIEPIHDGLDEGDETVKITLTDGTGYTLNNARKTATLTIIDDDTRGLTFHRKWPDVAEGGSETMTLRLSSQPTAPVTVKIVSNNQDVTVSPTSLTFNPSGSNLWSANQEITVSAAQDDDAVDDTATLTYTTSGGDYGGANALSIDRPVSVDDDDKAGTTTGPELPRITLAGGAAVTEGTAASFTVNADPAPTSSLTINVEVSEPDGQDFVAASQEGVRTVTLNAGATSTTFTVPTVNDNADEPDGAVQVFVNDGAGYVAGQGSAVDVKDDDDAPPPGTPALQISRNTLSVSEGGSGSYTVRLATEPTGTVTVNIASNNADVTVSPAPLTFHASGGSKLWSTPQTVTVSAAQDNDTNNDSATLTHTASGGGYGSVTGSVTVTVTDDDGTTTQATLSLSGPAGANEGDSGTSDQYFTVSLSRAPSRFVSWQLCFGGSATLDASGGGTIPASADYQAISGQTPIDLRGRSPVCTSRSFNSPFNSLTNTDVGIRVKGDTDPESAETVIVTLTIDDGPADVVLGTSTVTYTIRDDDSTSQPAASFASGSSSAAESAGTRNVTVNLSSAAPSGGLTLNYGVTGTATAGSGNDFTIQGSGTLSVAAGATSANIPVAINDDSAQESAETVILTLSGGAGYTLGATTVHTLTITDNDTGSVAPPPADDDDDDPPPADDDDDDPPPADDDDDDPPPADDDDDDPPPADDDDDDPPPADDDDDDPPPTDDDDDDPPPADDDDDDPPPADDDDDDPPPADDDDDDPPPADDDDDDPPPADDDGDDPPDTGGDDPPDTDGEDPPDTGGEDPPDTDGEDPPDTGGEDPPDTDGEDPPDTDGEDPPDTDGDDPPDTDGDDPPATPVAQFASASSSAAEDAGTHNVTLNLDPPAPSGGLTLAYTVTGTATAGSGGDFTIRNAGTLSVAAGATTARIPVVILDDSTDENAETVILTLTGDPAYTLGGTAVHTLTIHDNDEVVPVVGIAAGPAVTEGGVARFTLTATPAPSSELNVSLTLGQMGDFLAATDSDARTVTIDAGQTSATYTVATVDDEVDEADGGVTVTVEAAPTYTVSATGAAATVAVSDDDTAGLVLSTNTLTLPEGAAASYTVKLATRPAETVKVTVSGHAGTELTIDTGAGAAGEPDTLTFTNSDWNTAQRVLVMAGKDADLTDDTATLTHKASSGYGLVTARLTVETIDEDLPTLSIADAEGPEGTHLAFRVTLSEPVTHEVEVTWSTREGTARAGQDFQAETNRLRFGPGETEKAASVATLDDAHDDPDENFTVVLAEPRGTTIENAEATGTIRRGDDAIPQAWLGRFGRTVAQQALTGIADRIETAGRSGFARAPGFQGEFGSRLQQEWASSRFAYTGQEDSRGGVLGFWGRGSQTRFDGREDTLGLDGDVSTTLLGADYARDAWLLGVAITRSSANGGYGGPETSGIHRDIESRLTAAIPYASWRGSERLNLWVAAGRGAGDVRLEPDGGDSLEADLDWTMAAAGLRSDLFAFANGPAIALVSDALWARTESDATAGLLASDADIQRLRIGIEGSRRFESPGGGHLTPKLEVGARHDGGDAETGLGMELGGGIAWSVPRFGLQLDLEGRSLLTHDDGAMRDRGFSAAVAYDPQPDSGAGLSIQLRQDLGGPARGGLDALFAPDPLALRGDRQDTTRWTAEMGYGLPVFGGRFLGTPLLGYGVYPGAREIGIGWRLVPEAVTGPLDLDLGIQAARSESFRLSTDHRIGIQARARW